jgi:hypothetical protein
MTEYDRIGHGAEWDGTDIDAHVKIEALKLTDQHLEFDTEAHAREIIRARDSQGIEKAHEQALRENINNGAVTWLCSPGTSAWSPGGTRSVSLYSCGTRWRATVAKHSSPPAR